MKQFEFQLKTFNLLNSYKARTSWLSKHFEIHI